MLTANQFHKQSGVKIGFQEFLDKMKETFGENFMEAVNAGKVKLQEVQKALGLDVTPKKKPASKPVPRKKPQMARATGNGMKCTSCGTKKSTKEKNKRVATGLIVAVGAGAIIYWAMKNRK